MLFHYLKEINNEIIILENVTNLRQHELGRIQIEAVNWPALD